MSQELAMSAWTRRSVIAVAVILGTVQLLAHTESAFAGSTRSLTDTGSASAQAAAADAAPSAARGVGVRPDAPVAGRVTTPLRGAPAVTADQFELPKFQPGMWEFRRTVIKGAGSEPQVKTLRICSDPSAEFRGKLEELQKKGCQFEAPRRRQDQYISSWTCVTSSGMLRFHDTLIAQNQTHYQNVTEGHNGGQVVRSNVDALRVGECEAGASPVPRSHPSEETPFYLRQLPKR